MGYITFDTTQFNDKKVPASFHDAILKVKDASTKQWVSFDADGSYMCDVDDRRVYCPIGYLLPLDYRKQLRECVKSVMELPSELGIEQHELERYLGMSLDDAAIIQDQFDTLSRDYLTVAHAKYARDSKVAETLKANRRTWNQYLNSLLERENYSFE